MIDEEQRKALINYRLEQAKESVSEAELLLDHGKYRAAVNRIYYGMFYALLALANKHNFATSKHGQLFRWFNRTFIKRKILDKKLGRGF